VSEQTPGTSDEFGGSGEFSVGSLIAGYRLEERIGRGGMAVVFRAYDARLDRQVALKLLAPALSDDDAFRQRFIRESRIAAAVDDPHITPVFEAGEANGVLFIAMRYVRGGDVRSLIDRLGPLPAERVAEMVSQVASALDAAHARGLVHRDVKPGNMLLEASQAADRPDHVYLSDFGLSKTALGVSGLTATGQFLGTLDYVAPEQIEGRPLDARTDVYALACSAVEMLTGAPPFKRGQGMSVMYAHLSEPPPSVRQRRPDLSPDIDAVINKALAKSADDRYPTAGAFATALRQAVGGPFGRGRPDTPAAGHPVTQVVGAGGPEPADRRESAPDRGVAAGVPAEAMTQASDHHNARVGSSDPSATADARRPDSWTSGGSGGERSASRTDAIGVKGANAGPTGAWTPTVPQVRPAWRTPLAIAAALAVALVIGGGAYMLSARGHAASHTSGSTSGSSHAGPGPALAAPGCSTATAAAPTLNHVTTATTAIGGAPFGAAVTADGQYSFVTVGDAIAVLRNGTTLTPTLIRTIPAPGAGRGVEVTSDGKYLVAAAGSGAVVVSVAAAEQGAPNPVVGSLTTPSGMGASQVLITPDSRFAFVTLQSSSEMAVFNLQQALAHGFGPADVIGYVPLGEQPVGMVSDGSWLYVTDFSGKLNVLSLSRAETDPPHAVVSKVPAGCQPARVVISADHQVLWVTARASDALLAFNATKLRTDPGHALIADVTVGEFPLGEALIDHGTRLVIADSNANGVKEAPYNIAVVSTADALNGKPALLGYVPTGPVPRQVAILPGGSTLLVTVENGHAVETVNVAELP
jgi:DNA-binding beta-propeller fold protein YncE